MDTPSTNNVHTNILFTDDQLDEVRALGNYLTPPRDVAIALCVDEESFIRICRIRHLYPNVYDAYHAGRVEREIQLRKANIDLAAKGSSPALADANQYIDNLNAKLLQR